MLKVNKSLQHILDSLNLKHSDLEFLKLKTKSEMDAGLKKFKKQAEQNWKNLSKLYHPDIVGVKHEDKMKAINNSIDYIRKLEIRVQQRQPVSFQAFTDQCTATTTDASSKSFTVKFNW